MPKLVAAAAVLIVALGTAVSGASAAEVELRAASAFASGTTFSKNFEAFVKRVNELGKGNIRINYVGGGAKVIDPFELGNAVRTGVVDIGNLPGSFYTNIVPEADALKMIPVPIHQMKGKPIYDLLQEIHGKKANAHLLARQKTQVPFHLFVNKRIEGIDLSGLRLRTTPIFAPFFTAMGATAIRIAPGEIFAALERGVVDGYGWPLQGIFDLGWQEATKFRVDPGFYNSADELIVNLSKWDTLTAAQKSVLEEAGVWMEKTFDAEDKDLNQQEDDRQRKQGIQIITFDGELRAKFLKLADETAWQAILKASPDYGSRIKTARESMR